MGKYYDFYKARHIINDILDKDFVGPVKTDEILSESPASYYIMGKLYPQDIEDGILDLASQPVLDDDSYDGGYDSALSLSNGIWPSSMGITFIVKEQVNAFQVEVSYARYKVTDDSTKDQVYWKRIPVCKHINIHLQRPYQKIPIEEGAMLSVYINDKLPTDETILTLALINTGVAVSKQNENVSQIMFQAGIKVKSETNIFNDINYRIEMGESQEFLQLEMLYCDKKCYAQGHGCSVEWESGTTEPHWIATSVFPSYDLKQMEPRVFDLPIFSIKYLAEGQPEIISDLQLFTTYYEKWIQQLEIKLKEYPSKYRNVGKHNIAQCYLALKQMRKTIQVLQDSLLGNQLAWKAFCYSNEVMFMQRCQTLRKSRVSFEEQNIKWYPFQLAFYLCEILSFILPKDEARQKVDLLWFPTGGGKTEAYLGIAAFAIFLRRLRNTNDDGVTVIMRYTLRLLTLQQFERATLMIASCELLRQKYHLGGSEISIGLWVGGQLTPNRLADAKEILCQPGGKNNIGSPLQLLVCPWCGEKLCQNNYRVNIEEKRMEIHCSNPRCQMHSLQHGIPVHLIDEAIYEHLPSFIVATVDKFAQLPLNSETFAIFGRRTNRAEKKPPELIIQDELHLISGPLGTITGIYEAAVNRFCEYEGIPVKIIASTATIRNASEQIKALYGRSYTQFPPQGLSCDDSFFAVLADSENRPTRQYHGVMGIGTTMTTTFIRINAALLFAVRYLIERKFSDEIVDGFWTIIDYFNTLRELGGAATQVIDDVQSRFKYLCDTKFANSFPVSEEGKKYKTNASVEITSHLDATEISEILQTGLNRKFTRNEQNNVYNFALASNMISVGVDVNRLGVMVVSGQPKTNAEYIQATSRIGRRNPGEIITLYNAARSRDRSHYEQFLQYHSSMYRYVEASSLTPFSDRARDRGLQALFVVLCRYYIDDLRENNQAGNILKDSVQCKVKDVKAWILHYAMQVDPVESQSISSELDLLEEIWKENASSSLWYYKNSKKSLLKKDIEIGEPFRVMNSMRNVDTMSGIYLERR